MKPKPRFFTIDEANRLIPEINQLLGHLLDKKEKYNLRHDMVFMHELLTEAEQAAGSKTGDAGAPALERDFLSLEEDLMDLEREVSKISALGCIVHDLEGGYVDFPSEHNGQRVFLCWKRGEAAVSFYHSKPGQPGQRTPLS